MVDLYLNHWNEITKLISITLVSTTSVSWPRHLSGNYLLKQNVIIVFQSYVRIMSESYIRLTLENYLIKPCKWDQDSGNGREWEPS